MGGLTDDEEPNPKRQRTDSGYGEPSQTSQTEPIAPRREDSGFCSGARACSPILLSDEPEITVIQETKSSAREPSIVIYVGAVRQQIAQSKYLPFIWKSGLDSPCVVCHEPFTQKEEPPIRTFTFATCEDLSEDVSDITQLPIAPHPLRVLNRHFRCLKSKRVKYIPISHVWHDAVSKAQLTKETSLDPTRLAYQVPIRSLLALTRHHGPIEIWHDYLSVPQWQTATQQRLLLQLPSIFSYPERMVMHLDDVSSSSLQSLAETNNYGNFIDGIAKLTNSRYFERMWVALEYIQCKQALILTKYYDIFDKAAAEVSEISEANLNKYISKLGQNRFNELAKAKGFDWSKRAGWEDQQTWKVQDPRLRTLGAAIFIIGQKACRDHHDYFFSLRFLLDLRHDEVKVNTILSDKTFESYWALCWDALKRGDYSPLLFRVLDCEEVDPRAPWLRGHSRVSHQLWDFGTCRRLPSSPSIIRDGKIKPMLELIGVIQDFWYDDLRATPAMVFYLIGRSIINVSGTCPKAFCSAIDRIFPSAASKGAIPTSSSSSNTDEATIRNADLDLIRTSVKRLSHLQIQGEHQSESMKFCNKFLSLLGLGLPEKQSSISRIKAAQQEMQWYRATGPHEFNIGALATVKCKGCSGSFLFRILLWDKSAPDATKELYRIPGLLYDDTLAEGVGLVVCNGKIIGKTAYATPACECKINELVAITSQAPATD